MVEELTDKEEKIVRLLSETGLNKNIAKVVVFLSKSGEAISRDIERAANLRQPEVSLAMKELKEWGWVKERELKKKGKGRPLKSYKLTLDLKEIVSELVEKKREEIKRIEKDLEELEKLVGLKS
ncbi:MAG: ArsR family transcriptional regulator [Archaeoglobales archaeon]|nr:MAG: ArsR family transcriptional regulator [Archaeoglobales archaeon]